MAGAARRTFRDATCVSIGASAILWNFRYEIQHPDKSVASLKSELHQKEQRHAKALNDLRQQQKDTLQRVQNAKSSIASRAEAHKALAKKEIKEAGDRLRRALRNYKEAVEWRRARKVGKAGTKVLLNVLTFGAAEGVAAAVDIAEMALDVADAICDGSCAGVVGALLDGVVDIGVATDVLNDDMGELFVELIDVGQEVCEDWSEWSEGFEKIRQVQDNLVRLEESMLKGQVKEEGVQLLRAVADMLCVLERFNIVQSADKAFFSLLDFHVSKF